VIYICKKFSSNTIANVFKILKACNINAWLDHGSLLGIIRDGKFIDWDNDVDIGAWYDSKEELILLYKELKRQYKYVSFNKLTNAVSIRFFDESMSHHWSVDIVFYHRKEGKAIKYYVNSMTFIGRSLGRILTVISGDLAPVAKKKWINNALNFIEEFYPFVPDAIINIASSALIKITPKVINSVDEKYFNNIIDAETIYGNTKMPRNAAGYLEVRYGENWKIPKKSWDYLVDDGGVK
jgi:hypothetical protein